MCYSKILPEKLEKMRTNWHKSVDEFCDTLKDNKEEQAYLALENMEKQINEDVYDAMDDLICQNNNQESTPLLLEEQQELRRRVQKASGPDPEFKGPEAQQPGESFYHRLMRMFQEMLQRLKQTWQDVLTWVQEKADALCSAVMDVWNVIRSFCSSVAQCFLSPLQA